MKRQEAFDILDKVKEKVIGDVYDTNDDIQEAILLLHPNFEYPDWSYRSISEFIYFVSC